jgi:hypothetical protein
MKRFWVLLILVGLHFLYGESDLPKIKIHTLEGEIQDTVRVLVSMSLEEKENEKSYLAEIEYRGSSSQAYPKKGYGFEFVDEKKDEIEVSPFGLPKDNDWVLYASYNDKSLMRNVLPFQLFRQMGNYSSRTKYCELYLNDEYRGIYILMEKIKRSPDRVDISKLDEEDNSGDDLTGGYILKIDKTTGDNNDGWYSDFLSHGQNIYYQYHYPKADKITSEQKTYIQSYIHDFVEKLQTPNDNIADFIDMKSLVDFFIMIELSYEIDGYRLSTYFYKDKDSEDGRLHLGPIWDFDRGFGGSTTGHGTITDGWFIEEFFRYTIPQWMISIWETPVFQQEFKSRWKYYRSSILSKNNISQLVQQNKNEIGEAYIQNFIKWGILDSEVFPYPPEITGSYSDHVSYFENWIYERIDWIDSELGIEINTERLNLLNEIVSSQDKIYADDFGEYDDWIELYNSTSAPIVLDSLYITDTIDNPTKHQLKFSQTLNPNEYLLLWADNDMEQGQNHLGFKLNCEGEMIFLFDKDGTTLLDFITIPSLNKNQSFAYDSEEMIWKKSDLPTPYKENKFLNEINATLDLSIYPNPSSSSFVVNFKLDRTENVEIAIYNIRGQKIKTIQKENLSKGRYNKFWNGNNEHNRIVANGVYFVRVKTSKETIIKKVFLMKK